jgi:HPr kinase/phosphorylase
VDGLSVQDLEQNKPAYLNLTLVAGRKGMDRRIIRSQVQKMGLALAGFVQFVEPERLQIIGNAEIAYFKTLSPDRQEE